MEYNVRIPCLAPPINRSPLKISIKQNYVKAGCLELDKVE